MARVVRTWASGRCGQLAMSSRGGLRSMRHSTRCRTASKLIVFSASACFDGGGDLFKSEVLDQPQHLDVLPAGVLPQSRLQQPAQLSEALGQLPSRKRRGLVQRPALVFEQSQVVQRIVDGGFAFIAALVFAITSLPDAITMRWT